MPFLLALTVPTLGLAYGGGQDWAQVVSATPVVQVISVPQHQRVCRQVQVRRMVPERRSATPSILGAVIGGIIGNQFGGGRGRAAMTVAGAALGSSVAQDEQYRRYPPRHYQTVEDRCGYETHWHNQEQITAWDVTYRYQGKLYQTRMNERPGDRIPVRVEVSPAW